MQAKEYFEKGQSAFVSGKHEESLDMFSKALEEGYEPVKTLLSRGTVYLHMDDHDKAIEDFSKALEEEGDNDRAYYYRGVVRLKTGDYQKAAEDIGKSLAINSDRGAAYLARGMARAEIDEEDGAVDDFKQAMGHANVEVEKFLHMMGSHRTGFQRSMALLEGERGPVTRQLNQAEVEKLKKWMAP